MGRLLAWVDARNQNRAAERPESSWTAGEADEQDQVEVSKRRLRNAFQTTWTELLRLHLFDKTREVRDPNGSEVLVPCDLREDRSPDRHLSCSVSPGQQFATGDHALNSVPREHSSATNRYPGQVWRANLEELSHWTGALPIRAMTYRAIRVVKSWAGQRLNEMGVLR